MPVDHWLPGFNFNVEEWDAEEKTHETLAICRTLSTARAAFKVAIEKKPRRPVHDPEHDARSTSQAIGHVY
jgi:hypothetical protein